LATGVTLGWCTHGFICIEQSGFMALLPNVIGI
jgi:hypothetical protein